MGRNALSLQVEFLAPTGGPHHGVALPHGVEQESTAPMTQRPGGCSQPGDVRGLKTLPAGRTLSLRPASSPQGWWRGRQGSASGGRRGCWPEAVRIPESSSSNSVVCGN